MLDFLTSYGYFGMFLSAFLAGSFFPFSSEAVMVGLLATGLDPFWLLVYGTGGNALGSAFNYGVGRFGRPEWISRYLHVSDESLARAQRFLQGRGAWMAFFAFVPVLGSAIMIALGLMRANMPISFLSMTIGKIFRYGLLVAGTDMLIG